MMPTLSPLVVSDRAPGDEKLASWRRLHVFLGDDSWNINWRALRNIPGDSFTNMV